VSYKVSHNVLGLGAVERQPVRGEIAPNPCYTLFVLIFCAEGKSFNH